MNQTSNTAISFLPSFFLAASTVTLDQRTEWHRHDTTTWQTCSLWLMASYWGHCRRWTPVKCYELTDTHTLLSMLNWFIDTMCTSIKRLHFYRNSLLGICLHWWIEYQFTMNIITHVGIYSSYFCLAFIRFSARVKRMNHFYFIQ